MAGVRSKKLTMSEVAPWIVGAGVTGRVAVAVLATIWAESGGDAFAIGGPYEKPDPEDPGHLSIDRGLVQWNSGWWPEVSDREAFDGETAVGLMIDHVVSAGSPADGLSTWNAFDSLAFLDHVPAATEAIRAAGG